MQQAQSSIGTITNPYVGPRSFRKNEPLYGRDRETRDLLDLLVAERVVLLYSPSGAGKSSLLNAALIPALEADGFGVLPIIRVHLDTPAGVPGLRPHNRYIFSALLSLEANLPEDRQLPLSVLAGMTLDAYLKHLSEPAENNDVVLIFDQFEEVLTLDISDQEEKNGFFEQVGQALRNRRRWALFSMREDFVASLDPYLRPIPTRFATTFRLDLLTAEGAQEAIQRPAQALGVEFTTAAAEQLINDLRTTRIQRPDGATEERLGPYVEPVQLQVVCYRLWEQLPPRTSRITPEHLKTAGDVDSALADYYALHVADVARQANYKERFIREWVAARLINAQGLRNQVLMEQDRTAGLDNHLIRGLQNAHLVRAENRRGSTWFELAHDRLVRPVRTSNTEWFLHHLTPLQRQATLWRDQNKPDSLLLDDKTLAEMEIWAAQHRDELNDFELEFLRTCQRSRDQAEETRRRQEDQIKLQAAQRITEMEKEKALAEQEKARVEQEAIRKEKEATAALRLRARIVLGLASAALVLFLGFGFAMWQAYQAQLIASTAERQAQAAQNEAATATYAYGNVVVTAQAASTEIAFAQSTQSQLEIDIGRSLTQVAAQNATATTVAVQVQQALSTAAAQSTQQSINARAAQLAFRAQRELDLDPQRALLLAIEAVNLAPTLNEANNVLLTAIDRLVQRSASPIGQPIRLNADITALDFHPSGQFVAIGSREREGVIYLYGATTQSRLARQIYSVGGPVTALAFNPAGDTLAVAYTNSQVVLWDTTALTRSTSSPLSTFTVIDRDVPLAVAWSPDGRYLAVGQNGLTSLFQVDANRRFRFVRTLSGTQSASALAWSPRADTLRLAGAGDFDKGKILIWDNPQNTNVPAITLPAASSTQIGHREKVRALAWSPDARTLASGSQDGTVMVWDAGQSLAPPIAVLAAHTGDVYAVDFRPDGAVLLSGGNDTSVIVWDVAQRATLLRITASAGVRHSAFNPTNPDIVAVVANDRTLAFYRIVSIAGDQGMSQEEQGCDIATRNFTQIEWGDFFPGEPYRRTCDSLPEGP